MSEVVQVDLRQHRLLRRLTEVAHHGLRIEGGAVLLLSADGVGNPHAGEPIADLFENVSLTSAAEDYAWVNTRQGWGFGTVNFATGKIHIDTYMQ